MKHIYHSTSKIDRIGLFAGENIKKDEVIQHIKGEIKLFVPRNKKEGEEITIDYSIIEGDDMWKMKCNCGEKNCRKIIRSIQYLPTRTFKKYLPYIPTYFKKVYKTYN